MKKHPVLIAESDADLRDIYQGFLHDRGFVVEAASDGLDCVRMLRAARPAVLVLDLELPWGGGDGVLSWLREESLMSDVAVVLTATAGAPPGLADDSESPVVKTLAKPFTLSTLLEAVLVAAGHPTKKETTFDGNRPALCSEMYIG